MESKKISTSQNSTSDQISYFGQLPDELILLILSFLEFREELIKIGMTNKHFQNLSRDTKLNQPFKNLFDYSQAITTKIYEGNFTLTIFLSWKKCLVIIEDNANKISLLDIFSGKISKVLPGRQDKNFYIPDIQLSPNEKYLALCSSRLALIYNLKEESVTSFNYGENEPPVKGIWSDKCYWVDNDYLAIEFSESSLIPIYNIHTGQLDQDKKISLPLLQNIHSDQSNQDKQISLPSYTTLCRNQKYILVLDYERKTSIENNVPESSFIFDSSFIKVNKIINISNNSSKDINFGKGYIEQAVFSPTNDRQCVCYDANTIYIFDVELSENKKIISIKDIENPKTVENESNSIYDVKLSRDGNLLFIKTRITGGKLFHTPKIVIFDINNNKKIHELQIGRELLIGDTRDFNFFIIENNKILISHHSQLFFVNFPVVKKDKNILSIKEKEEETSLGNNPFAFLSQTSFSGNLSNLVPTSWRRNRREDEEPENSDKQNVDKKRCIVC